MLSDSSAPTFEKRCLLCSMLAEYIHLVDAACNNILLFALIPALCLVLLSLLPRLFLLTLGERRSASWHMCPLESFLFRTDRHLQLGRTVFAQNYQRGSRA